MVSGRDLVERMTTYLTYHVTYDKLAFEPRLRQKDLIYCWNGTGGSGDVVKKCVDSI
jgi:hypothetical protein